MALRLIPMAIIWCLVANAIWGASGAMAGERGVRPSTLDSFPLGSGGGVLCRVQSNDRDSAISGMFDRAYLIVCRDAATAIGRIYVLHGEAAAALLRLDGYRTGRARCNGESRVTLEHFPVMRLRECTTLRSLVGYHVYTLGMRGVTYVAEGFSGYDAALRLGLRNIVEDRLIPGEITAALTEANDAASFARVQASNLDLDRAMIEGYRLNNSGDYAEAAEFFEAPVRGDRKQLARTQQAEYLVNLALQQSNLGSFAEADRLFAQAQSFIASDPIQLRLFRNYSAAHLINQRKLSAAQAMLDRPVQDVAPVASAAGGKLAEIEPAVSEQANAGSAVMLNHAVKVTVGLTPQERAEILDAQALQLRGTIERLGGHRDQAQSYLMQSLDALAGVRGGRVRSTARLRAQAIAELALVMRDRGDFVGAEKLLREVVALIDVEYPDSTAATNARARLALFLFEQGRRAEALSLYRQIIAIMRGRSIDVDRSLLNPYLRILVDAGGNATANSAEIFEATEMLARPGVALTQSILARELSGGIGEAARLFRQSVNLDRDIVRTRVLLARLNALAAPTAADRAQIEQLQTSLSSLTVDQSATQARLNGFPQYRVLSPATVSLPQLQAMLKPDEAYLKLAVVGEDVYVIMATAQTSKAMRSSLTASALADAVSAIRKTVLLDPAAHTLSSFALNQAHQIYVGLLAPISDTLDHVKHLTFEPDGAMLQLPLSLLIAQQSSIDSYLQRSAKPGADPYDYAGIDWLARRLEISTSVSAGAFRDIRISPRSNATHEYLGFGENQPMTFLNPAVLRHHGGDQPPGCAWPLATWNSPIPDEELRNAATLTGAGQDAVITGAAFSDTAIKARTDLAQYRILHFATHGLLDSPRLQCMPFPSLLTSFGGADSDGLLSFREIYDLHIDADLVILSACDTAGRAGEAATQDAGLTTGGDFAFDGLVRSFVGAGARAVLASYWPVPQNFDATGKLIGAMFGSPAGTSLAGALDRAEIALMSDPLTSHPHYWAGFAVIGDGERPMLRRTDDARR